MSMWRKLERPNAGPDFTHLYAEKIAAMTSSLRAALLRAA